MIPRVKDTTTSSAKPYDRPSTAAHIKDEKPDTQSSKKSTKKTTRQRADTSGRKWTAVELLDLFNHALAHGQRDWDKAVQGRTANQCAQTWRNTLLPFIRQAIESKK
ncbi:uncharacterized protein I303_100804 [Kwoniella dejecticola CBS 10117]|uniref:Myb-like domain-containing protein n=1 Tax=Kwoniella dejecticola CBS 10117 TaxID=1296121 RepID=A0A1A6AG14_9TREE|nr:uncharacterized protein I303_00806 [Kwoniella dejecticola CBS 10117]OBR88986.1 hypothetical protein I303_00806 [Kwoniella dejecticola CBS 10117]